MEWLLVYMLMIGVERANMASHRAEVVKIEHPVRGDDTRQWGPPYAPTNDGKPGKGESAYYLSVSLQLLFLFPVLRTKSFLGV
jgi:hypothetical protein